MSGHGARPVVVLADDDGAITSNLAPFLDRKEFLANMIVPPMPDYEMLA